MKVQVLCTDLMSSQWKTEDLKMFSVLVSPRNTSTYDSKSPLEMLRACCSIPELTQRVVGLTRIVVYTVCELAVYGVL